MNHYQVRFLYNYLPFGFGCIYIKITKSLKQLSYTFSQWEKEGMREQLLQQFYPTQHDTYSLFLALLSRKVRLLGQKIFCPYTYVWCGNAQAEKYS